MKVWVHRVVVAGSVGLASWGWAGRASASGFASAHFGGEHGNVTETNALSLYYNPGAIAFSEGTDFIGDGELALRHASWNHPASKPVAGAATLPNGADYADAGLATLTNVFGGPALAATHKFGNLALGGGLFVPFGGRVNWDSDNNAANPLYPRATDGVQRWHGINAALTFIYTTVGAAYRFGPVSVGVSGNFIIESITTSQAHTLNNSIDSTSEGRASLDVSGFNGSFGAGAMVEAWPEHLWVSYSYQAAPSLIGRDYLTGTLKYENPGSMPTNYNVDFHENLPDIHRAGVRLRASSALELRLFGDLTRWSVLTSQCVNLNQYGDDCKVFPNGSDATKAGNNPGSVQANLLRNWKDTYGARLGASYWVNPNVEVFAGLGYETGAAPDATIEPSTMDGDNVLGAIGGRFKITDYLYVSASYTSLYFFDKTVTTSQLDIGPDGKELRFPTQTQDGNGTYTQYIGVFDGNIEAKF